MFVIETLSISPPINTQLVIQHWGCVPRFPLLIIICSTTSNTRSVHVESLNNISSLLSDLPIRDQEISADVNLVFCGQDGFRGVGPAV